MKASQIVFNLKETFKNEIRAKLTKKYLELHDGLFPKWDEDEEIVLTKKEVGTANVVYIPISNTYDDYVSFELFVIEKYIVTLDGYFYFEVSPRIENCFEYNDSYDWTEISVEDLASILDNL
jgi:hypothetical protein